MGRYELVPGESPQAVKIVDGKPVDVIPLIEPSLYVEVDSGALAIAEAQANLQMQAEFFQRCFDQYVTIEEVEKYFGAYISSLYQQWIEKNISPLDQEIEVGI